MIGLIGRGVRRVASAWSTWSSAAPDVFRTPSAISHAGKRINGETALEVSAVWSCVRRTAEVISALPLALYERDRNGAKRRVDADILEVLSVSPNADQTAVEFWESMVANIVLRGNACAERLTIGQRLVGLRPLPGMLPTIDQNGAIVYEIMDRGKRERFPADRIFHLRGFGSGSGLGMSAIRYGAHSMGLALAADEAAGKVFSNAMMPSGAIETEQGLTPEQREALRAHLGDYAGSSRTGKILTLEAGLKWRSLQMNPDDAQLLDTRRFNVEDVCRWFGVPPVVIGHSADGQTMWGSGVEQIMLSWLTLGINPLLTRIEKRIRKDLLPADRPRWFVEFTREAMLQMDSKAKADFLTKMRFAGFMTGNEGRDKINMPRHPDGDELLVQTSLAPADLIGKET